MAWDDMKYTWPWTPTTIEQKKSMRELLEPPEQKQRWSKPTIKGSGKIISPTPGSKGAMEGLLRQQGMYGVPRIIPAIAKAAEGFAFVIELVTYTLYFFEEGFVIFMRGYADVIFKEDIGNIAWLSYVDFDYIFRWNLSYFYQWALFAVYSLIIWGHFCKYFSI